MEQRKFRRRRQIEQIHATTVVSVSPRCGTVAGDGQVTVGNTVMNHALTVGS